MWYDNDSPQAECSFDTLHMNEPFDFKASKEVNQMSCKLCGGSLANESQSLYYCRDCGAKYGRSRGGLDMDWAERATKDLEAMIGRGAFQSQFEDNHQLDGLDRAGMFVIRIRALRQFAQPQIKLEKAERKKVAAEKDAARERARIKRHNEQVEKDKYWGEEDAFRKSGDNTF